MKVENNRISREHVRDIWLVIYLLGMGKLEHKILDIVKKLFFNEYCTLQQLFRIKYVNLTLNTS